jgi:hypothetical protein
MIETNEEDEEDNDNYDYSESIPIPENSHAVVLYQNEGSKLSEAQELLNNIETRVRAVKKGEVVGYKDDIDPMLEIQAEILQQLALSDGEVDLRRRLQEQEDNLADIFTQIEAREEMLKNAMIENDQLMDIEDCFNPENGEISLKSAAQKFSSLRGARLSKLKASNTDMPEEKIIFELEEESDDEETNRYDLMIENAKNFAEDFEAIQSSDNFYRDHLKSMNMISEDIGDDERERLYLNAHNQNKDILEESEEDEEAKDANPNE